MAGVSPAFQFYPQDYLSSADVMCMTPAERGAYVHLLAHQWIDEDCSLPDDDRVLAVLSGMGEQWLNGCSTTVRTKFKRCSSDPPRIANPRLRREREKQLERREAAAAAGRKSGQVRRLRSAETIERPLNDRSSTVEPTLNTSISSSSSSSSSVSPSASATKKRPKRAEYPDDYERFWKAFPRKRRTKKAKAFASWKRAVASMAMDTGGTTPEELLIKRAGEYAASVTGQSEFVQGPEPWLNGGCWDDDPVAWQGNGETKPAGMTVEDLFK